MPKATDANVRPRAVIALEEENNEYGDVFAMPLSFAKGAASLLNESAAKCEHTHMNAIKHFCVAVEHYEQS